MNCERKASLSNLNFRSSSTPLAFGLLCLICLFILVGCASEPEPTPVPTLSAEMSLARRAFTDNCAICHATTPDTIIRGPALYGIATRAATRVPGQDARAYIFNSIMRPADYIVEGFDNIMPNSLAKTMTGEEVDAVLAYLLTLGGE